MDFSEEQLERYSRQIILKELGIEGQEKLLKSKILVIGAGGLGSPVLFYLVAAGVGHLGIADFDEVNFSNLQRQILHSSSDVNRNKAQSAQETLSALNPDCNFEIYPDKINETNILQVMGAYDFIIDATDNFKIKYLINDACIKLGKPFSMGGIVQFEGQLTTVLPHMTPCYRCLFPKPPKGDVPTCSSAGILGSVAGVVGSLQATEAIKYIMEREELLTGKLLLFRAMDMEFNKLKYNKNPNCPVCSKNPEDIELAAEENLCDPI